MSHSRTFEETACNYCTDSFTEGYNRDYCSEYCKDARQGENLLEAIAHDHRFCGSCATKLKDLTKPRPSDPDCFIGYQHLSGETLKGEKHVTLPDLQSESERLIDAHGTICGNCGSTSHSDTYVREEGLLDEDVSTVARRVFDALAVMREEGQHELRFDVRAFVEAWNREHDWAYAIGKSITDDV